MAKKQKQVQEQKGNLWVRETATGVDLDEDGNETERSYGLGDSGCYETFTADRGELYKSFLSGRFQDDERYGRPSKMLIDVADGPPQQVGWTFTKKVKYTDCEKFYMRTVWVEVFTEKPTVEVKETAEYAF